MRFNISNRIIFLVAFLPNPALSFKHSLINTLSIFKKKQSLTNTVLTMSTAVDHTDKDGAFKRRQSKHRSSIQADSIYKPEADRYHLHIALACPWANGALVLLKMKGLDHVISHSIVHPTWGKTLLDDPSDPHHGWLYRSPGDEPMSNSLGHGSFPCDDLLIPDSVTNAKSVREVYNKCGDKNGPFTTPLLYDKKSESIISNESTEILPMINSEFNEFAKHPEVDLYPDGKLGDELQKLNDEIVYPKVNNGVYRCGFAKGQEAYNKAVKELFDSLDYLEDLLAEKRFLGGDQFTWLDLRLFMTLVRFDPVYTTYFKCNLKRLIDYPNLLGYTRDIYQIPEVRNSISMDHIKTHYYTSHPVLNTYGIIPTNNGPDLNVPSGRDKKFG